MALMFGTVRKRGDSWQWQYFAGRGADGKPKYKSMSVKCSICPTEKDAEKYFNKIAAKMTVGKYVAPGKETVAQFMERFLESASVSVKYKTYKSYALNVRLYINPHIGHILLSKLTPLDIQKLYANLLKSGRTGKTATGSPGEGLSNDTVNGVYRVLKRALNLAVDLEMLSENPVLKTNPPGTIDKDYQILDESQAVNFLKETKKAGLLSFYLASISTGMRQGELLGLRWQDIDLENGIIHVRQQLLRGGLNPVFGTPKSKRRMMVPIPMTPLLVSLLKEEYALELEQRQLYGSQYRNYDLVWHVAGGGPYIARNVTRRFKSLLKQAGLPEDVRFHDLRHTCATMLLGAGVSPALVQDLLGHADIRTTMRYSHTDKFISRQTADNMQEILKDVANDE
jgi:integrase